LLPPPVPLQPGAKGAVGRYGMIRKEDVSVINCGSK